MPPSDPQPPPTGDPPTDLNEVHLLGRVSGPPTERELPSGDLVVTLRVILDRPGEPGAARRQVDTLDLACWTQATRAVARQLDTEGRIEVHGALRRRFYRAAGSTLSRYEVEVTALSNVVT